MIDLNLTPVEVAVFGSNPAPDTVEAFRYRCERVQRLIPQPKRRRRQPRLSIPGGLLTASEAAAKLGCSIKTLNGHVDAGDLKYVIIGHGTKRPRKLFTDADLNQFIANQTREALLCPLPASRARHTGTSNSKCEVIDFAGPRKPPTGAKRKK